ncbi:cytochrome P450 [Pseudonocardia parietis]|uniref:Cytochrome P450 n=1 Tax=Pseudonocardia parietis TaxID=570936 RepID=A0ABS4VUQ9_9PSEU|nr:cytochrome P450 [Pseudonocardia parietis]MBP2367672.1 cytochrome P450 [Pseudonocardia parietis]
MPIQMGFGPKAWLITRYVDIKRVLSDAESFISGWSPEDLEDSRADPRNALGERTGNLLVMDPPDHTRLRRLLTGEFTMRRMRRLEPRIVAIVDEHLDAMERKGPPADLVADFALPIPSLVICELLGVPLEDQGGFQERTRKQMEAGISEAEQVALAKESLEYMRTLVDRKLRDPGDDILGMLVRDHGDDVTRDEMVGIAGLLLLAGHETTSNMLGLGTLALLRHPEQLAIVRDDPDAAPDAVEELLRWLSVVNGGGPRMATRDVEISGQLIRSGELIAFNLPTANRDPALLEDAERLDVTRKATTHVGFGHGVHHCLGAPLARMEMRIAFPAVLRRFPDLALACEFEDVPFAVSKTIYGLEALPVKWTERDG